jgi:hypothetical protein
MDPALASIIVALIGAVSGLLGLAIKEFKSMKEKNDADHGAVMLKLNKVQKSVDKVGERLDDHIDWHLKK